MSLRVSNIRLAISEPEDALRPRLAYLLGLDSSAPLHYRILRKALDARDSRALQFVYTAEVVVPDDETLLAKLAARKGHPRERVERYHEEPFAAGQETDAEGHRGVGPIAARGQCTGIDRRRPALPRR